MKFILSLILSFHLLSLAPLSAATSEQPDWYYITTSTNGTVIHARTSDLMAGRSGQEAAKVWVKYDHEKDKTTPLRRTMVLYQINCVAQTYRRISATFFKSDGATETDRANPPTQYIIPDSNMASVAVELCADPGSQNTAETELSGLPTT